MLVCAAAVLGPCASQTSQITSLPARAQRLWFGPALPSKPVELVFGEQGTAFLLCFLCRSCLKRCLSSQSYMKSCLKLRKVEVLPIKPKRRGGAAEPGLAPPPGECVTLCQMTRGLLAAGILNRDMCLVLFDEADVLRGAHRRTLRTRPRCAARLSFCCNPLSI